MRNPFRRQSAEKRVLDENSVSWPVAPLASPEAVSETGALRLGACLAAGRLLASNISGLPLNVYRQTADGKRQLPLPSLFAKPSAQGNLHDWMFRAVTSLVYRGNAVGVVTSRDRLEYPTSVEWLDPANVLCMDRLQMTPMGAPGSFTNPKWFYLGEHIPSEDIVHIPWFQLPGRVWGLSPMGAYATTVSTGLAAQKFTDDWYRSGGVPTGRFKNTTKEVDQPTALVVKRRLMQAIAAHEPIVHGNDWEYTPFTISPNEARFIETMQLSNSTIAAIYGIPPEMIGGTTGGSMSYSSPEQRQIELVSFALSPWLSLFNAHFTDLIPRGQFVKINPDGLIVADMKSRIEYAEKSRLIGLNNLDELRDMQDWAPIPGGKGQDYTAMPFINGTPVAVPAIRSDGRPLRLITDTDKTEGRNHG
jgi:HK97 family phage portal protein